MNSSLACVKKVAGAGATRVLVITESMELPSINFLKRIQHFGFPLKRAKT
jgi:hypothetical protein